MLAVSAPHSAFLNESLKISGGQTNHTRNQKLYQLIFVVERSDGLLSFPRLVLGSDAESGEPEHNY